MPIKLKLFNFDHEPSFAELWEICVYNLLYNTNDYCDDVEKLFERFGVSKKSKIIDVAAGSGFPALGLSERGYKIDCADGFLDEVDLFNKRAVEKNLSARCSQVMWSELPQHFQSNTYDFMFCRGNSFIYALGGWNNLVSFDAETALKKYHDTAKIFFDLLKQGGILYIDKFKDSEISHKNTVAQIKIGDNATEDLIFWTERFPEEKIRRASMLRNINSKETGVPNISYDLTFPELREILLSVGFSKVEQIALSSEKEFDILVARK
ncbi:MAG: hypothetical protein NT094_02245 [Candidatus Staskawiczbacteria bacterium]|nr:hypothetical protein [Candidatus Staskawiczbacteria bacterium]